MITATPEVRQTNEHCRRLGICYWCLRRLGLDRYHVPLMPDLVVMTKPIDEQLVGWYPWDNELLLCSEECGRKLYADHERREQGGL